MLPFIRPTIPEPDAWLPYLSASYAQRIFSNSGPAALRLDRVQGREVVGVSVSGDIGAARRIHGDGVSRVAVGSPEVSGVNQCFSVRRELGHKRVGRAGHPAVETRLEGVDDRKVERAGFPRQVDVSGSVERDGVDCVAVAAAEER